MLALRWRLQCTLTLLCITGVVEAGHADQSTTCHSKPAKEGETAVVNILLRPQINLANDTVYAYLRRGDEGDTLHCDRMRAGSPLQCQVLQGSRFQTDGLKGREIRLTAPKATPDLEGVYVLRVYVNSLQDDPTFCNVTVVTEKESELLAASDDGDTSQSESPALPIAVSLVAIVLVIALIVCIVFWFRRRKRKSIENTEKSAGADSANQEGEGGKLLEENAELTQREKETQPEGNPQTGLLDQGTQPEDSDHLNQKGCQFPSVYIPNTNSSDTGCQFPSIFIPDKTSSEAACQFPSIYVPNTNPSASECQPVVQSTTGVAADSTLQEDRGNVSSLENAVSADSAASHTKDGQSEPHRKHRALLPFALMGVGRREKPGKMIVLIGRRRHGDRKTDRPANEERKPKLQEI